MGAPSGSLSGRLRPARADKAPEQVRSLAGAVGTSPDADRDVAGWLGRGTPAHVTLSPNTSTRLPAWCSGSLPQPINYKINLYNERKTDWTAFGVQRRMEQLSTNILGQVTPGSRAPQTRSRAQAILGTKDRGAHPDGHAG